MKQIIFTALATIILGGIPFLDSMREGRVTKGITNIFEAKGNTDTSQFGLDVVGVGDQNQDGYADILVSARGERNTYLFYGGAPMDSIPDMMFTNTFFVAAANVSGDTGKDFIFGTFGSNNEPFHSKVYFGGNLLDTIPDLFLQSPDSGDGFGHPYFIGDFNGDGYEDFALAATAYPAGEYQGKVRVYFGGSQIDSISDWVATGDSLRSWFGVSISGGDFNGDGFGDLVVGGFHATAGGGPSYLKVFFGSSQPDTLQDALLDARHVNFVMSPMMTIINDVNGDAISDLIMSIGGERDTAAYIFFGGTPLNLDPDVILHRARIPGDFSPTYIASSAGDINRDGFGDVILGNAKRLTGFGEVLIYLGGPNMSSEYAFGFTGLGNPYDGAGVSVGNCGDANRDRVDDVLFGAWNGNPGSNNYPGRVEIFSGDTTITGITTPSNLKLPQTFQLFQNYPNPFNGETSISFSIPFVNSQPIIVQVSLSIFDIQGREVRILLQDQEFQTGNHIVRWDRRDNNKRSLSSGVFFCRLTVNGHTLTNKLLLIR